MAWRGPSSEASLLLRADYGAPRGAAWCRPFSGDSSRVSFGQGQPAWCRLREVAFPSPSGFCFLLPRRQLLFLLRRGRALSPLRLFRAKRWNRDSELLLLTPELIRTVPRSCHFGHTQRTSQGRGWEGEAERKLTVCHQQFSRSAWGSQVCLVLGPALCRSPRSRMHVPTTSTSFKTWAFLGSEFLLLPEGHLHIPILPLGTETRRLTSCSPVATTHTSCVFVCPRFS